MEREARFHFEMFALRPVSLSRVSSRFPSLFLTGFVFSRCYFPFLSFSFVFACVLALACVCVCVCFFVCACACVFSFSFFSGVPALRPGGRTSRGGFAGKRGCARVCMWVCVYVCVLARLHVRPTM